jgi:glycosyltransferase WbpL
MSLPPAGAALILGPAAFLASALLSGLARRYALASSLLDVPNERSSHTVPTPRGGGLAIVAVVLAGVALLALNHRVEARLAVALGGGAVVGAVGWLDDRRGLAAGVRLLAHAAAAVWAVVWLGGMPSLTIGVGSVNLGWAGALLAVLALLWATNLYNFMDGIDGLAASEAVTVGLAGAILLARADLSLSLVALLLACAAAGFLVWNWPPAQIFMGDVGSGFLGFAFGTLAVASENAEALPAFVWLILLGAFFADATVTVVRRMARGERWYRAHRSHAYQRAVQAGCSHSQVTSGVVTLNVLLAALAAVATTHHTLLLVVLAASALALAVTYLTVERLRPMRSTREGRQE